MRRLWLIFAQTTTMALALVLVLRVLAPSWFAPAPAPTAPSPSALVPPAPAAASYRVAAAAAMPAVVAVTTTRPASGPGAGSGSLFGTPGGPTTVGLGSGVIVDSAGYVLTNDHVIAGAEHIEVKLADRRDATAAVVGRDPDTDLAVLKIALPRLPSLRFADDNQAHVGDVVLAIGYPFGVGQTVTQGIVSALDRNRLGINTYEDFIQTDAAINPGNSGGALVDARGGLLGINTAIFSSSGGSLGIGFAVPASIARKVMQQLIAHGRVVRGWIGVEPQDIGPRLATALHLPSSDGLLITAVLRGGPAASAGMRPGDVVLDVAGQPVRNTGQLLDAVAALQPGSKTRIRVWRDGRAQSLQIRVGTRPTNVTRDAGSGDLILP